jgi:hypothetical protein
LELGDVSGFEFFEARDAEEAHGPVDFLNELSLGHIRAY